MKELAKKVRRDLLIAGAAVFVVVGVASFLTRPIPRPMMSDALDLAFLQVSGWPERPRLTAETMLERYGAPDGIYWGSKLEWTERAPWKRVAAYSMSSESPLEQTVSYRARPEVERALAAFGNGLSFDRAQNELSARSGREELNFLALNLGDEIANGRMTAGEAQAFFKVTADRLASGKTSRYCRGLLFDPYQPTPPEPPEKTWRAEPKW